MMYESPIKILYGSVQRGIEEDMFKAILSYDIQVDKDELIRALKYDRDMYEAGYIDGKMSAMESLVRCKDCKHNVANMETDPWDDTDYEDIVCLHWMSDGCGPNDFCSRGERRNDADLHLPD